jgi:hypothetical protein
LTWVGPGQASADTNSARGTDTQASALSKHDTSRSGGCGIWDIVPSDNEGNDRPNDLYGVAVVSANDIWAVGLYLYTAHIANTLIEHWDGNTWNVVASPNFGPGSNVLYGVTAVSQTDVWAVGYYSESYGGAPVHALIDHWDGNAWSVVSGPDPESGYLEDVKVVSRTSVWVVGNYFNSTTGHQNTLIEQWNGTSWNIVSSPNFGLSDDNLLRHLAVVSDSDVWAVGSYYDSNNVGHTLTEHWDGNAWNIVASPDLGSGENLLLGLTAVSGSDVWAVGQYADGGTTIHTLTEHWDGSAWNIVPSPDFGSLGNALEGVAAASGSDVWSVGYYYNSGVGHALIEHWDGSVWSVVFSPASNNESLWDVAAVSGSNVWAVGYYSGVNGYINQTLIEQYLTTCPTATPSLTQTPSNLTATPTQTPGGPTATGTPIACTLSFEDVPVGSTFYPYIQCMACQGIINGYPCGGAGEPCNPADDPYFRPASNVTRGQFAKIASNAAGLSDPPGAQQYEDVVVGSTFYDFIWRLSDRGLISGYPCSGVGEPCGPNNLPYFRPNADITRGQIAKIDSNAAGYNDTPGAQQYEDVVPGSTFYDFIWRLSDRGLVNGYPCGGIGEPCGPGNLPYFRPGANATRGQASKVVSNTFFLDCQPVGAPEQ